MIQCKETEILYKDGYKHQLHNDVVFIIDIYPDEDINTKFIALDTTGLLTIRAGYAWDGASGPTWDNKKCKCGSLVHDALYQLMREAHIDRESYRRKVDKIFHELLRQDGMWVVRARVWYRAVRVGAKRSSITGRKIKRAP